MTSNSVPPSAPAGTSPVVLGWTGPTDSPLARSLFEFCTARADAVVRRELPTDWNKRPSRLPLTHGLIWQPHRHLGDIGSAQAHVGERLAAPLAEHRSEKLPERPTKDQTDGDLEPTRLATRWLVVRGPGVSPKPNLPGGRQWVESVDWCEAPWMLEDWLKPNAEARRDLPNPTTVLVMADAYVHAEPFLETLPRLLDNSVTVIWPSGASAADWNGRLLCLWDDSVAPPTDKWGWKRRLHSGTSSHWRSALKRPAQTGPTHQSSPSQFADVPLHFWLTSSVTPAQWDAAVSAGIHAVLPKPFRLQSLRNAIASTLGNDFSPLHVSAS